MDKPEPTTQERELGEALLPIMERFIKWAQEIIADHKTEEEEQQWE